jgi:formate dehydrogenase subunit gamma
LNIRQVPRFDRIERYVHWTNATLFFVLIATGAAMYIGPLSTLVARRQLVETIHIWAGLLLPIPVLLALLVPAGRQFRRDIARANRFTNDDRLWWSRRTRVRAQLGKFNPGQKLNLFFIGGAIVVMFGTGAVMQWASVLNVRDSWRTGATFTHDVIFVVLCVVIAGHILFALGDRASLRSMRTGNVPEEWAREERPRWWAEMVRGSAVDEAEPASANPTEHVEAGVDEGLGEALLGAGEVALVDPVDGRTRDRGGSREL